MLQSIYTLNLTSIYFHFLKTQDIVLYFASYFLKNQSFYFKNRSFCLKNRSFCLTYSQTQIANFVRKTPKYGISSGLLRRFFEKTYPLFYNELPRGKPRCITMKNLIGKSPCFPLYQRGILKAGSARPAPTCKMLSKKLQNAV